MDICRFTPEEKAKRHPCAYMPFGYGPRNCIGMRFALLEAKMALIEIVSKFRIVLAPETKVRWCVTLCYTAVVFYNMFLLHEEYFLPRPANAFTTTLKLNTEEITPKATHTFVIFFAKSMNASLFNCML